MTSPHVVRDYLHTKLAELEHEVFVALLLDSQNRLIEYIELFRGTLAQTSVYPREVVKVALSRNAAAMILAHNHPSGVADSRYFGPLDASFMRGRTIPLWTKESR